VRDLRARSVYADSFDIFGISTKASEACDSVEVVVRLWCRCLWVTLGALRGFRESPNAKTRRVLTQLGSYHYYRSDASGLTSTEQRSTSDWLDEGIPK